MNRSYLIFFGNAYPALFLVTRHHTDFLTRREGSYRIIEYAVHRHTDRTHFGNIYIIGFQTFRLESTTNLKETVTMNIAIARRLCLRGYIGHTSGK